ncbi:hypothetical protein [Tabrizicola sp.]|uniref:hypothetical protein n=1 Tax=Tabrizicola sp. TaxID=2005166 RepID=UPI003F33EED1
MGLKVKCGEEFSATVKVTETGTRRLVVGTVLTLGTFFLVGSCLYSLYVKDFSYMATVWGILAPIYGGIAAFYFSSQKAH